MFQGFRRFVFIALLVGSATIFTDTARSQDVITLKLHHFLPAVSNTHANMLVPWAKKVEEESGGKLKIEIYPSMQLGGAPPQLAGQARDGVVDMVWTLPGYTPGQFPRTEVFELPFIHSSTVATTMAINEFAANHPEDFKGYKIIALHVHGGNSFHSRKPIKTAADLKGTKIRTPTRTGAWMIEAMGATPIGAPVPKIPEMLSKGIVDSVLIPFEIVPALKVNELVDDHAVLGDPKVTRINTSTFMFVMNRARYDALPPNLQKVIDNNSGLNIARWVGEIWDEAELRGVSLSAETGQIVSIPPSEVAKLRKATEKPVADRWVKEVTENGIDGAALLEEARALIKKNAVP